MEFLPFMFFSTLDSLALIIVVLTLFRFRLSECLWPALLIAVVMSLQSYLLREEALSDLVPYVNALLITFLLTILLQVPLHWSLIGSFVGYFAYILFQALIVESSFGYFSVEQFKRQPITMYIFQTIVSMLTFIICRFLYSRGLGFATNFKKRLKGEAFVVGTAIIIGTCLFGIMLVKQEVMLDLIVVSVAMAFFLYILIRKEVKK